MEFLVVAFVVWCVFAALGGWIAEQKNRGGGEGVALGFLFGPLGVLVEALLPTLPPPPAQAVQARPAAAEESEQLRAHWAKVNEAEREEARRRAAAQAEAKQVAREARAASRAEREAYLRSRGVEPGPFAWYGLLPDWGQAIVLGLTLAVPLVLFLVVVFRPSAPPASAPAVPPAAVTAAPVTTPPAPEAPAPEPVSAKPDEEAEVPESEQCGLQTRGARGPPRGPRGARPVRPPPGPVSRVPLQAPAAGGFFL